MRDHDSRIVDDGRLGRGDAGTVGLVPARGEGAHPPAVHPGVLLLDQAGWHTTTKLTVPANITLVPLPARSPELNPVETIWQFMRDNWLGNRIFKSYADILDHCCYAWNTLIDRPWHIMSIGLRAWAHEF